MSDKFVNYDSVSDLGDKVPDLKKYLRPGEKVISVYEAEPHSFKELPNYIEELSKLCGVEKAEDIGKKGAPIAATSIQKDLGQGLFECKFGRDGLIAARNLLAEFPDLARATLLDYATRIGMIEERLREEEFGRMFHEDRKASDPIARKLSGKMGWEWPFYATVDATPLFVNLLYEYLVTSAEGAAFLREKYIGRNGKTYTILDALYFSMSWIISRLNRNPEKFLEYKPAFSKSLHNQVMEDSWDSHFHSDGTMPNFRQGIASTEAQGLTYDALIRAARIIKQDVGVDPEAEYFLKLAEQLKSNIFKHLWIKDGEKGFFAVGTDRNKWGNVRPLKVQKAIPFFLLNSDIFSDKTAQKIKIIEDCIHTLFTQNFLCAAGIRSLALNEQRFMPSAYHNGSSWPMQTFEIANGLRKQGYPALANELDERIISAVEKVNIYPEFFYGGQEKEVRLVTRIVETYDPLDKKINRREQPAQQIQLWTLSAYAAIKYRQRTGSNISYQPFEAEILSRI